MLNLHKPFQWKIIILFTELLFFTELLLQYNLTIYSNKINNIQIIILWYSSYWNNLSKQYENILCFLQDNIHTTIINH